jgi:hypothetical protein
MINKIKVTDNLGQFIIALIPISLLIGTALSESLIVLLIITFIIKIIQTRDLLIFKKKIFYLLMLIWLSLIINSYIALDLGISALRNFTFFKYILMILAFISFFDLKKKIIFYTWFLTIFIVIIDIYFEFFIGHNLFGVRSHDPNRVASFLGKELKIAHFIIGFGFLSLSFLIEFNKKNLDKYKPIYNLFLLIIIIGIFITGERANFIRGLLFTLILMYFINKNHLNKFIFTFLLALIIFFSVLNFERIENKFYSQIIKNVYDNGFSKYFKESQYGAHFDTAKKIFEKYPFFGVGNKNFRVECQNEDYYNPSYKLSHARCSTHPHQIYYELLSEHGILGTFVIISIIFYLIFKNSIIYFKKKNLIHLSSLLFTAITFLPLIPSGSFFSSFGATIFWINFAIMCNIYEKLQKKIN